MFEWLRRRKLRQEHVELAKRHARLLEEARDLQRGGDIRGFAAKTEEASVAERELDAWLVAHPDAAPTPPGAAPGR